MGRSALKMSRSEDKKARPWTGHLRNLGYQDTTFTDGKSEYVKGRSLNEERLDFIRFAPRDEVVGLAQSLGCTPFDQPMAAEYMKTRVREVTHGIIPLSEQDESLIAKRLTEIQDARTFTVACLVDQYFDYKSMTLIPPIREALAARSEVFAWDAMRPLNPWDALECHRQSRELHDLLSRHFHIQAKDVASLPAAKTLSSLGQDAHTNTLQEVCEQDDKGQALINNPRKDLFEHFVTAEKFRNPLHDTWEESALELVCSCKALSIEQNGGRRPSSAFTQDDSNQDFPFLVNNAQSNVSAVSSPALSKIGREGGDRRDLRDGRGGLLEVSSFGVSPLGNKSATLSITQGGFSPAVHLSKKKRREKSEDRYICPF